MGVLSCKLNMEFHMGSFHLYYNIFMVFHVLQRL